jgi:hypothetical protein
MRRARLPFLCVLSLAAIIPMTARAADPAQPSAAQVEFFEQKIRPALIEHCYKCHSAEKVKGGLQVDGRDQMRKGGDTGPAVVPGDPDKSLLLKAVRYTDPDLKMPPKGKLPDTVIADLEKWIKQGAADPRDTSTTTVAVAVPARKIDVSAGKQFWSFQPPQRHTPPEVRTTAWPRQTIDRFLLARLEQAGLTPSPSADRRIWIRRVTFDLTGLPPTPEEVEAFVADAAPGAEARVVERLLSSPHYGERWARMWLDVARYAEDQAHIVGSDQSLFYPQAYLYRDWVIRALNGDLPYDRFVRLQLAADLIAPDDPTDLPALGYLGLGPKYYGRGSLAVKADEWEDRVDVVGRGLLGLTLACARCHDHKFDPIPTEDYYGLAGVFASTDMYNRPLDTAPKADAPPPDKKAAPDKTKSPKNTMHIVREGRPTDLNVFVRGDVSNKGALVPRHFLHVLCSGEPAAFQQGSGRRELAEAIVDPHNPLTARVIVNRVWAQLFGRELVATPSNFGKMGERPTHPELLDDLAVRFVENGWSLKWLMREIALSAAYRQSSHAEPRTLATDPENRLLGRMSRRRLSVEAWRDSLLAASGRLDGAVGGPSLNPQDPQEGRRTVYSTVSRLSLNPLLAMFDFPDPNLHADRRVETTTPLQKLFVLNSPFMVDVAAALTERLWSEVPAGADQADRHRVERAYHLLYGRPPTADELRLGLEYIQGCDDPKAGWQRYAHVLLAANEMLYVD